MSELTDMPGYREQQAAQSERPSAEHEYVGMGHCLNCAMTLCVALTKQRDALQSQLAEKERKCEERGRHLTILGEAIAETARRAGILRDDVRELTGPQILMLSDDIRGLVVNRDQRLRNAIAILKRFHNPDDCGDHCSNFCKQCSASELLNELEPSL